MKSARLLTGAIALVSLAAGVALFQWLEPDLRAPPVDGPPPAIELHAIPLTGLDGATQRIGDWRGQILIVNFWATWCVPCRREIPTLIEIQREYAGRGVRVIGIAFDGAEPVRRFAREYAIDYPLFLAGNGIPMYNAAFGNSSGALPFTAMLDRDGRISERHLGEVTRAQLEGWLAASD